MTNRRNFLSKASGYTTGLLYLNGTGLLTLAHASAAFGQAQKGWHDTFIRFAGKDPSDTATITAAQLKAGQQVTLSWTDLAGTPEAHGHSVVITPAMINQVNSNSVATGTTGETKGHTHQFTIDPNAKVPNGNFIAEDGKEDKPAGESEKLTNAAGELAMILGFGEAPYIFVEILSAQIDVNSLNFCITKATSEQCVPQNTVAFMPIPNGNGRRVFGSTTPVTLADNDILRLAGKDTAGADKLLVAQVTRTAAGFALK